MTPILDVRDLRVSYDPGTEILKGVGFAVGADEFVAIIGPSGAGKSTLIRCVNRLVQPTQGSVLFNGRDLVRLDERELRRERRNIGMIFQQFNLIERLSVMDNVLTGRLGYTGTLRSLFRLFPQRQSRPKLRQHMAFYGISRAITIYLANRPHPMHHRQQQNLPSKDCPGLHASYFLGHSRMLSHMQDLVPYLLSLHLPHWEKVGRRQESHVDVRRALRTTPAALN